MRYGKINAPIKIDITTGDALNPKAINYSYKLMFDQGTLKVLSYHIATVVAEKLETVISRGIANTRGRDYYDLYILHHMMADRLVSGELNEALRSTCKKRGSLDVMENWESILEEVRLSDVMNRVWNSYVQDTSYAEGLTFGQTLDAVSEFLKLSDLNKQS